MISEVFFFCNFALVLHLMVGVRDINKNTNRKNILWRQVLTISEK